MRDAVSGTDPPRPCANFQPNPFISFGGDAPEQTDRQTNSKINIPHYHEDIDLRPSLRP